MENDNQKQVFEDPETIRAKEEATKKANLEALKKAQKEIEALIKGDSPVKVFIQD